MKLLFFLLCSIHIACSTLVGFNTNIQRNIIPSIETLFLSLPAEAFHFNNQRPSLSPKERQVILQSFTEERAIALSSDFKLDTTDSSDKYLKFDSFANDEGISVFLKIWQDVNDAPTIGVNITYSEMCCEYSKVKFYRFKDSIFTEVTDIIFPELNIEDFAKGIDSSIKRSLYNPIDIYVQFFIDRDDILVSIDQTPMIYDLEDSITLKPQSVKLTWNNNKFLLR